MSRKEQEMTLGHFLQVSTMLGREDFLKRYREPVMVAMGVLETDEIRARVGQTMSVRIASPMTYDRKEVHPLAGRVFRVPVEAGEHGELVIGRAMTTDIEVPDDTVSSRHATLNWVGSEVTVTDLASTNRTMVNLQPLKPEEPRQLLNEDIITVGRHSFQFYLPAHFFRILEGLAVPMN